MIRWSLVRWFAGSRFWTADTVSPV